MTAFSEHATVAPESRVLDRDYGKVKPRGHLLPGVVGALALTTVGHLTPGIDFALSDSAAFLAVYAMGYLFVAMVAGQHRSKMLSVYGLYAAMASAAFLAAAVYGSFYGHSSPVFMIDRYVPRDDYYLYFDYIRPFIGKANISITDEVSNAPLHWFVNVKVQELIVGLSGRPQIMVGNALNIALGAMTASFIAGAIEVGMRPGSKRKFPRGLPLAFVFSCPWLLAASVIAIREIWVYAVFAAAFYCALAVSTWSLATKVFGLGAIGASGGWLCLGLRSEMVPMLVLLVLLTGLTVRDRARMDSIFELTLMTSLVVITTVGVVPFLSLKEESVSAHMEARALSYIELGTSSDLGEQGTVNRLVGNGFTARAVFQTLWMPIKPLPKVSLTPGSTYQLGKQLMPAWIIACVTAGLLLRRRAAASLTALLEPAQISFARRYLGLLMWMLAMAVLVGATSAEARHFFVALPVACAAYADVFQTAARDTTELRVAWSKGVWVAACVLLLSTVFTVSVFGISSFLPDR